MTTPPTHYSYKDSVKSNVSDELINTYVVRPLAGIFVRIVYQTSLHPNHVTIISVLAGVIGSAFYLQGTAQTNIIAGAAIWLKDILDSADGQLARAKQQYSRAGRFLDSIGDAVVNCAVFTTITYASYQSSHSPFTWVLGAAALVGTTLRVSYHVFYQTQYLHLQQLYAVNRVSEEIREEDRTQDRVTFTLQTIFNWIYGWQDRLMIRIDGWSRRGLPRTSDADNHWYCNRTALRLSGLLGLGTELFLLMVCSLANVLDEYLWVNVLALNGLWLASILYRRRVAGRVLR